MDKMIHDMFKGLGLIAGGVFLILYVLGFIQKGISFLLIIVALLAVYYGAQILGIPEHIKKLMHKH